MRRRCLARHGTHMLACKLNQRQVICVNAFPARLTAVSSIFMPSSVDTPGSLLERLRQPGDEEAWQRFVRLYTPLLIHWAGRVGISGAAAHGPK